MSKTEILAIILAVNGGLWLLLALIDWMAVRVRQHLNRVDGDEAKTADRDHAVPPVHATQAR